MKGFVKKTYTLLSLPTLLVCFICLSCTGCDEALWQRYFQWWQEQQQNGNGDLAKSKSVLDFQNTSSTTSTPVVAARSAEPVAPFESCDTLVSTTPRGLACLHCLHPNAQHQAAALIDLLHQTCLRNIAMNFLVDGTFDFDADVLEEHIRTLAEGGRKPEVVFYLSNGPTQRKYKTTSISAFATKMSPEEFRRRIMEDVQLQYQYQQIVLRIIPAIRLTKSLGGSVILVPMLEDNLRYAEFQKMLSLVEETLPSDVQVTFARNACADCYPGNDSRVPAGVAKEVHSSTSTRGTQNGIVTNDGVEYSFGSYKGDVALEDMSSLRNQSTQAHSTFILWSGRRQGLAYRNGVAIFPHPDQRVYHQPEADELTAIRAFLQAKE